MEAEAIFLKVNPGIVTNPRPEVGVSEKSPATDTSACKRSEARNRQIEAAIEDLRSLNYDKREAAVQTLHQLKATEAVGALLEMLNEKRIYIGIWESVVIALGKIGDTRAVKALIPWLQAENDATRMNAVIALGEIGGDSVIASLRTMFSDHFPLVWRHAVVALVNLGKAGNSKVVCVLEESFSLDLSEPLAPATRALIALGLGEVGDSHSLELLNRELEDGDEALESYVSAAIDKIEARIAGKDPTRSEVRQNKTTDRRLQTTAKASSAARGLSLVSGLRSFVLITAMVGMLALTPFTMSVAVSPKIGASSASSPTAAQGGENIKKVESLLKDCGDARTYQSAMVALKKMGKTAVNPLAYILKTNAGLRRDASAALGMIGPAAVGPLVELLGDKDFQVRYQAIVALSETKDKRAVEPLIMVLTGYGWSESADPLLRDLASDLSSRAAAAGALGTLKDSRAIPALIAALNYEGQSGEHLRYVAADSLGNIRDVAALKALETRLFDKNAHVRESVQLAINKIVAANPQSGAVVEKFTSAQSQNPEVAALITTLSDSDPNMRILAISALWSIKDPLVVPSLIKVLDDPEPSTL